MGIRGPEIASTHIIEMLAHMRTTIDVPDALLDA
jgi:hypothetical protein